MSVERSEGVMKEFKDYSDGRQQWPTRVTKVLGIVQFVLGVAVICADVLAFSHTNLPIFAGVSTAFIFLASGAVAFVSAINTSHLLMVSSLFASFISSLSAIILIVHASILLFSHTSPICGLSSSCTGRTMHEVQIGLGIAVLLTALATLGLTYKCFSRPKTRLNVEGMEEKEAREALKDESACSMLPDKKVNEIDT